MQHNANSYQRFFRLWVQGCLIFILLSILLHAIYSDLIRLIAWTSIENAAFSHALIFFVLRKGSFRTKHPQWIEMKWAFGSSGLLLLGVFVAIALTADKAPVLSSQIRTSSVPWLAVFFVPILEEYVFRDRFGRVFKTDLGPLWGGYFSVIFFAWAHVLAIGASWSELPLAIPLGPLLLGLCCEVLFQKTQGLFAPILFHASANLTALIFLNFAPHWLDWLSPLYLGV